MLSAPQLEEKALIFKEWSPTSWRKLWGSLGRGPPNGSPSNWAVSWIHFQGQDDKALPTLLAHIQLNLGLQLQASSLIVCSSGLLQTTSQNWPGHGEHNRSRDLSCHFLELVVNLKEIFKDSKHCEIADCQTQNLISRSGSGIAHYILVRDSYKRKCSFGHWIIFFFF